MDHSSAHLMEFTNDRIESNVIESKFTRREKEQSLAKGEKLMHNKEQHQQLEYYSQLGDVIQNFDEVVLFGPTDAKVELLNVLKADARFEKTRIKIKQTDKMTENQKFAFIKEHFSRL